MEVANASLYDGVDRLRRGGDDGATASPAAARRCCPAGCIRTIARHARPWPICRRRSSPRRPSTRRARRSAALIDGETSCVVVQNPDVFGRIARLVGPSRRPAHAKGALLVVGRHRGGVLGAASSRPARWAPTSSPPKASRIGNALNFGGPYVGLFATPRQICAPDAGPPRRRDRRCRGPARLGADPLDARAAHPARARRRATSAPIQGCAPSPSRSTWHCSARPGSSGWRGSTMPRRVRLAERVERMPGVQLRHTATSSTNSPCACRDPAAQVVEALAAKGVLAGVPASRLSPGQPELDDLLLRGGHRN